MKRKNYWQVHLNKRPKIKFGCRIGKAARAAISAAVSFVKTVRELERFQKTISSITFPEKTVVYGRDFGMPGQKSVFAAVYGDSDKPEIVLADSLRINPGPISVLSKIKFAPKHPNCNNEVANISKKCISIPDCSKALYAKAPLDVTKLEQAWVHNIKIAEGVIVDSEFRKISNELPQTERGAREILKEKRL